MTLRGLFRLARPMNAAAAGLATTLGILVGGGTLTWEVLIPTGIVSLITAAGNAVNDCFDLSIDRVNRPDRPIPSGEVTLMEGTLLSVALFVIGNFMAVLTNAICQLIALFNSVLLLLYAYRLKRLPVLGNLTVSYLSGSIFLFGGAFLGFNGLLANMALALVTLFAMMARELIKSAEDLEGDRAGGAATLAVICGVRCTGRLAFACISLAVLVSLLPIMPGWGLYYLPLIGLVDAWMLYSVAAVLGCWDPGCVRKSGASGRLKAGMFAAVAILVIAAICA